MRNWIAIFCVLVLAACQTVPNDRKFSARQLEVLETAGFQKDGEFYELGINEAILFDTDDSRLIPRNSANLERMAKALLSVGIHGATVEGHTDSTGSTAYNRALSERRAQQVKTLLVASGMNASAIRTLGKGETDPIDTNATEIGRANNRRVEIVVSPADTLPF